MTTSHKLFSVIPRFKRLFSSFPSDIDKINYFVASNSKDLNKIRSYIEPADVLLIDLEGDQLGPKGDITLMQVNTFENNYCFLIDIKLLGDHELRDENGWLRKIFESDLKVSFTFFEFYF